MNIDWFDFIDGCIEFIFMSLVVANLTDREKPDLWRVILLTVLTSVVITMINSLDLPYHAFITMLGLAVFSTICLKKSFIDSFTDSITAFACGLIYEIVCELLSMGVSGVISFDKNIVKIIFLIHGSKILIWSSH